MTIATALLALRFREPLGADEAYLWYGTLRLLEGRVPHRDFKSYEPGRYVWCAGFAALFGGGLGVLRVATHAFFALGLFAALQALRLVGLGWMEASLGAVLLATWAYPAYKLYEPALWMFGFLSATCLILNPSATSAVAAGATIGGALFFGFNYFLYLGASHLLLWLVPTLNPSLDWALLRWAAFGLLLGAAPFGLMCGVPGFARAFAERRFWSVMARGSTNLPLPIPWPWRLAPQDARAFTRPARLTFQFLFLLLPLLPAAVMLVVFVIAAGSPRDTREWAGVLAATALGATGWHHAFSRADVVHLAQSMTPWLLLVTTLAAARPWSQFVAMGILVLASLATTWPLGIVARRARCPGDFDRLRIGGMWIWMARSDCSLISLATELGGRELGQGGSLLALPILTLLYPILGKIAPVYDIFCVYPAPDLAQERMLASIAANDVRLAAIWNGALDGREDLRFSATHPRVWEHLHEAMESVVIPGPNWDVQFFRARGAPRAAEDLSPR